MDKINFTQIELVEISDAISEVLNRLIASGDPEKHESQYGTLTLLQQAQAKIMPPVFGFNLDEMSWGADQMRQIEAIRRKQGLTATSTEAEQMRWAASVTPR